MRKSKRSFPQVATLEPRKLLAVTPAAADQMVVIDLSDDQPALVDVQGHETPIPTGLNMVSDPCLSPDRTTIVFDANIDHNAEIYTVAVDGSNLKRLTNDSIDDYEPQYSPDGKKIVYMAGDVENTEISVMNSNGTHQKALTHNDYDDSDPAFSPDGSKIIFDSDANGANIWQIYTMDSATGANVTQLTKTTGTFNDHPVYSPDGTRIAFISLKGGFADVWAMNPDGSLPTQLSHIGSQTDSADFLSFSPDGSSIVFNSIVNNVNMLHLVGTDGSDEGAFGPSQLQEPSWTTTARFSTLTGNVVTVTGTSSADHISIVDDGDNENLDITLNGTTETYSDTLVQFVDVFCGAGNDSLDASQAPENIYADGGSGNDNLIGGESNDTLTSGAGKNTLFGGDGDDRLNGSGGHDYIYGEAGNDRIYGNGGDDILIGGDNTDRIWGGDGDDQISGGNGNDKLYGQAGNDLLLGQNGDDLLDGSPGTDTLNGGNGTDSANAAPGAVLIHVEIL